MLKPLLSLVALSFSLSIVASATTVSLGSAPAGYSTVTFNSGLFPAGWTASGDAGIASTSVANQYTEPTGDTTPFAYVGPGGLITASFSTGITGLDLLWGSPDSWNSITFSGSGGSVTYVPGSGLLGVLNPDNSGSEYVLFTATPGTTWTSVTFSSTLPAFEFNTVSTLAATVATPEPATAGLLILGVIAFGTIRRRR